MRPRSCNCGECAKCKHRDYMRRWNEAHPGYAAASVKRRRQRDGDALRAYDRSEYYRNLKQHKARIALNQAVKRGTVERQPCEICDEPKTDGHHADYSKPLEVQWLCRDHHVQVHEMVREFAAWAA